MPKKPSAWDIVYSIAMAIACLVSYSLMTEILNAAVEGRADVIGGMWAAVSTAFVFRDSRQPVPAPTTFDAIGGINRSSSALRARRRFVTLDLYRAKPRYATGRHESHRS